MFATRVHGPALILVSIVTLLGVLERTGRESGPATVAVVDPGAVPIVEVVGPTVAAPDTPNPTAVPAATAVVVASFAASRTELPPHAVAAPRPFAASATVDGQASTAAVATPRPTATPRLYPTNREVGILRPDSTPTPVPYTGQKLGPGVPGPVARWEPEILAAAQLYRLDPNLIAALMQTESRGEPGALSPSNAVGLLQVVDGPSDPQANILLGTKMLAHNLRLFDEDLELALAAYNAGPRNVLDYKGVPPFAETQAHVERTLASYEHFRRDSRGGEARRQPTPSSAGAAGGA